MTSTNVSPLKMQQTCESVKSTLNMGQPSSDLIEKMKPNVNLPPLYKRRSILMTSTCTLNNSLAKKSFRHGGNRSYSN